MATARTKNKGKEWDYSGKDLVRACFLPRMTEGSLDESRRPWANVPIPMRNRTRPTGAQHTGQRAAYSESFRNEVFYTETKLT